MEVKNLPDVYAIGAHLELVNNDWGTACNVGMKKVNAFVQKCGLHDALVGPWATFIPVLPPAERLFSQPSAILKSDADIGKVKEALGSAENPLEIAQGGKDERVLRLIQAKAGTWAVFSLNGSYSQLPEAWGKAMEWVKKQEQEKKLQKDWDLGVCYEVYLNDYDKTPEEELRTEIRVPVKIL